MDQSVIDLIIDGLTKHSEISYRRPNANELEIFGTPTHGFDITLYIGIRENMLLFDQFHWHYDNTEEEINEMLNQITYALFGYIRIKEFSKKNILINGYYKSKIRKVTGAMTKRWEK
ncbi:hypothetical protein [Sphingobacterium sp.]|uniref:hypothetical protein n=1 Tax=Sphingobacterium sp. TaxID=341027 RepID=UPI0028A17D5A|nr:hypothetical protein [Sphingobacterium sp.]